MNKSLVAVVVLSLFAFPSLGADEPVAVTVNTKLLTHLINDEIAVRQTLQDREFFKKPLSDQSSAIADIVTFLSRDQFDGSTPKPDAATQKDFEAYQGYLYKGGMRKAIASLLDAEGQATYFDPLAKVLVAWQCYDSLYNDSSRQRLVEIDEKLLTCIKNAAAFLERTQGQRNGQHMTWQDMHIELCGDSLFGIFDWQQIGEGKALALPSAEKIRFLATLSRYNRRLPATKLADYEIALRKFMDGKLKRAMALQKEAAPAAAGSAKVKALAAADAKLLENLWTLSEAVLKAYVTLRDPNTNLGGLRSGRWLLPKCRAHFGRNADEDFSVTLRSLDDEFRYVVRSYSEKELTPAFRKLTSQRRAQEESAKALQK